MSADPLTLLVALDLMLEHGNVTRAASQLCVSQPALSAQLARLREMLGDPLLVPARGGRGMVLTARASAMKEPLRMALTQLRHVFDPPLPFTPARRERTFTLILNDNAAAMLAGPLAAAAQHAGGQRIRRAFLHLRRSWYCSRNAFRDKPFGTSLARRRWAESGARRGATFAARWTMLLG